MLHAVVLHRMQCFQNVFGFVNAAAYTPLPAAAQLTLASQTVVRGPPLLLQPLSHKPTWNITEPILDPVSLDQTRNHKNTSNEWQNTQGLQISNIAKIMRPRTAR